MHLGGRVQHTREEGLVGVSLGSSWKSQPFVYLLRRKQASDPAPLPNHSQGPTDL